ncbi:MAG: hypothetical protein ACAI35_27645 [Candidatus Methylacidiphilales bacterium]|nr:hypothetical protein [Candidatus Methylacidiphilales bacterium]
MKSIFSVISRSLIATVFLAALALNSHSEELPLADSPPAVAGFLPESTLLFLHIPDGSATKSRYETSNLRKFLTSPETLTTAQALWESIEMRATSTPMGFDGFRQNLKEAKEVLGPVIPLLDGEAFIALTGVNSSDSVFPFKYQVIAGIKPKSGTAGYDAYVDLVKSRLKLKNIDTAPNVGQDTVEGVSYDFASPPSDKTDKSKRVCFAKYDGWVLISIGEASLADFLQRATCKNKTSSFASNPGIKKGWQSFHKNADAEIMANVPPLIALLEKSSPDKQSATILDAHTKSLAAYGMSCVFKNGLIEDRTVEIHTPGTEFSTSKLAAPCDFSTLKYTSPQTVIYMARSLNLPAILKAYESTTIPGNYPPQTLGEIVSQMRDGAKNENLDLDAAIAAFGNEAALIIDSDTSKPLPEAGIFVKLQKPDDLLPFYKYILDKVGDRLEIDRYYLKQDTVGGYKVLLINYKDVAFLPPTVVTMGGGPVFGIFSSKDAARRYLTEPAATSTVADQAEFKTVFPDGLAGCTGAFFMNSPVILRQAAPTLRSLYGSYTSPYFGQRFPALANLTLPETLVAPDLVTGWSIRYKAADNVGVTSSLSGIGNQLNPLIATITAAYTQYMLSRRVTSVFDKINKRLEEAKAEEEKAK